MEIEDLILVSVDDHVVEPPDVFVGRVPKKYEDLAPTLIMRDDGTMALGTWQGIFLCEFDGPRRRSVYVSVLA